MPVKINRIPGLTIFCAGALSGLLLACLLIIPDMSRHLETAQKEYGQTLATTTSKRVIDASFNQDLVRLQLILQELVSHPHIVQATIHDVENNLLVQAGEVRPAAERHTPYTASISLHDSIAGYVTITLQNFDRPLTAILGVLQILAVILFALLAYSLYQAKSIEWIASEKPTDNSSQTVESTSADDEVEAASKEQLDEEHRQVYAVIHVKNWDVLKQQLATEMFRTTFSKLETIIRDVMALYNGYDFSSKDNFYTLKFNASDAMNEAIFRASCSAFLIVELASIINKVPLDLAAFVSANKEDLVPAKLPVAGLVMETHAAQDELIQRRLNFMEVGTEDGRQIVANFEQPFCTLLENQRKQLVKLLG